MFFSRWTHKRGAAGAVRTEPVVFVSIVIILAFLGSEYNIQEANVRAKVARTLSDMRCLATALETYSLDQNRYPAVTDWNALPLSARLRALTTPIAYLNKLPTDVFRDHRMPVFPIGAVDAYYYDLQQPGVLDPISVNPRSKETTWRLISAGPDLFFEYGLVIYDATNGTKSRGDIVWTGGGLKP
jgi:hypothetical protein